MSGLSFHHPLVLAVLPLVVVALLAWVFGTRRAARRALAVSRALPGGSPFASASLLAIAAGIAVLAAAQPRWGTQQSSIPQSGAELVIVVDVSRSMDAQDVSPSRLAATKAAIIATLDRLDGDRVGLVVFAGSARLRFPLTSDMDAARQVVTSLVTGPAFIQGGTSASIGLDTALGAFDTTKTAGRAVLFISDGDDLGSDPSASATRLRQNGIDLIVAGAGTAGGAPVPVTDTRTGKVADKLDAAGNPVVTHLNEAFLRALAGAAGGRYVGSDLSVVPGITQARLGSLERTVVDVRDTTIPIERYQWFAAAALAFLVLASVAEYAGSALRSRRMAVGLAATMALLVGGCATRSYDATESGKAALMRGDAAAAVDLFQEAATGHSDDPRTATNLAAALYAAKRYDEAIIAARRALPSTDAASRGLAYASIGHSEFAAGRLPESLDAFKHALMENPADTASRHDFEVVLALLQPPQPSNPQQNPNGSATPGGTPSPGATSSPGAPSTPQTPQDGAAGTTATPGASASVAGRGEAEIQQQLRAIDAQVTQILSDSGGNPDATQALQILQLLAERSRISQLRDPNGTESGPNDY